jgi:prenyltransferase beta subunit
MSVPSLDAGLVRERVLDWLQASALPADKLRELYRRPSPGSQLGLITREANGVRANLAAFWWTGDGPFLTISILALLDEPLLNRDEVIAWIKAQQRQDGLFRKGRLGSTVREATYAACVLLRLLGGERDETGWGRAGLVALLRAQQRPGERRHVAFLPGDLKSRSAELTVANCWAGSLAALGEPAADRDAAVRYLQEKQTTDGGFELGWLRKVPYVYEQAARDAVRTLAALDAAPRDPAVCVATLRSWQTDDGGFSSLWTKNPGFPVPRLGRFSALNFSSFVIVALALLGAGPREPEAARRKVISRWDGERGGFTNSTPEWIDFGHPRFTYWGLLALSLLGGLQPPPAPDATLRALALLSFPTA